MLSVIRDLYQHFAARQMFERWSPSYESDVQANAYSAADMVATAFLRHAARLPTEPLPLVADIGIGTGLLAQHVFEAFPCRIAGLDFADDMMAQALQKNVTELLIKCDAGKDHWPLESGSYHAVISAGLLEYFTPSMLQHFLQQSARILQSGGLLVVSYVPVKKGEKTFSLWHGKSGTFLNCRHDPAMLEASLVKAKFTLLEHTSPFAGSVFQDGSSYDYRVIVAQKQG